MNIGAAGAVASSVEENDSKFSIQYCEAFGRFLVANQDLDCHELIIDEKPIVVAPSGCFDADPATNRPRPICIGCMRSQNTGEVPEFSKCPCCSWPVCETRCVAVTKFHTEAECMLFQKNGICQSARSLRMVYLIRCYLMSIHDQGNWKKLLKLASSVDLNSVPKTTMTTPTTVDSTIRKEDGVSDDNFDGTKVSVTGDEENSDSDSMNKQDKIDHKFLTEVCQMRNIDEHLVIRINGVKRVNGFGFSNCDEDDIRYYGIAVYLVTSMASHSCTANLSTEVSYDPALGFPMRFRTKKRIAKGDVLAIAYRNNWLALGTLRRREKIFQDHKFWCHCSRCSDPRENSSQFSAVTCTVCRVGSLLPINPLNPNSPWKCDNSVCEQLRDEKFISEILERVNNSIETVLEDPATSGDKKFEQLAEILREHSNSLRILHDDHYLIMRAELEWIIHFPFQTFHRTDHAWSLLMQLVERAEHCKRVYAKLIPDWADKNYFLDIALKEAYRLYYLTFNEDDENNLPFHDLQQDLTKISLKYL